MNLEQAVNSSRIHYQGEPNVVLAEVNAIQEETIQKLWELGYIVIPFTNWGMAQSIQIQNHLIYGVNDRRKLSGKAMGY